MTSAMMRAVSLQRGSCLPGGPRAVGEPAAQRVVVDRPAERARQRRGVARRHLEGGAVRHRLGGGAAGGADDRQSARHGLRQHHAVALVERRHDEQVGRRVQAREGVAVDCAGKLDAILQPGRRDRRVDMVELRRVARCAGDGEPPVRGGERRNASTSTV